MLNTSLQSVDIIDITTILKTLSEQLHNVTQNESLGEGCVKVIYSEMEYLPWDNVDNIVSEKVETTVRIIKNNLLVLLFLIGAPANIINMAVFYKQGLQDRVNLCLFALALADELYVTMLMVFHGEQLYIQFTTKERFGPIITLLTNNHIQTLLAVSFVSPVLSAIIAIERCLCVFNPLKFQSLLRTRNMAVIIGVVYIVVLGLFFIVAFQYRFGCVHDPVSGILLTTYIEGEFYKAHKDFINFLDSSVFGFGLPFSEITVVSITTITTIFKLRQIVKWRSGTTSSISPREVALTKMLIGISILFIVCIFPSAVLRIGQLFLPEVNAGRHHHNLFVTYLWITEVFAVSNSSFNIFVYYTMGSHYRKTFWTLFGRKLQLDKS